MRAIGWLLLGIGAASSIQASSVPPAASPPAVEVQLSSREIRPGRGDASASLQSAVDAAAQVGAVVKLPAGRWPMLRPVIVRGNVALEGDARGTVLAPADGNSADPLLLEFPVGAANARVKQVTFDGGGIDFANPNPVISGTAGSNIVFDAVTVRNSRGIGLLFQGGMKSSGVRNSRFVNLGNHWKSTRNKADRIQGLVFCCGQGNSNNFAAGNYFQDIGLDALQIGDQAHFCAASNVFKLANGQFQLVPAPDYPAGIFILHSTHVAVTGNIIDQAAGNGIDAPGLQDSCISNNVVSGCGGCGIGLFLGYDGIRQTRGVAVIGNTVMDNVRWSLSSFVGGITIAGGTPSDIFISDNTVTDTQDRKTQAYGIQVRVGTEVSELKIDRRNRLSGNRIAEMAGAEYTSP